jgi:hypothetical protein
MRKAFRWCFGREVSQASSLSQRRDLRIGINRTEPRAVPPHYCVDQMFREGTRTISHRSTSRHSKNTPDQQVLSSILRDFLAPSTLCNNVKAAGGTVRESQ